MVYGFLAFAALALTMHVLSGGTIPWRVWLTPSSGGEVTADHIVLLFISVLALWFMALKRRKQESVGES